MNPTIYTRYSHELNLDSLPLMLDVSLTHCRFFVVAAVASLAAPCSFFLLLASVPCGVSLVVAAAAVAAAAVVAE